MLYCVGATHGGFPMHVIDTTTPPPTDWTKRPRSTSRYWFDLFDQMPENSSVRVDKSEAPTVRVYFSRWRNANKDNKKYALRMRTPDDNKKVLAAWKVIDPNYA